MVVMWIGSGKLSENLLQKVILNWQKRGEKVLIALKIFFLLYIRAEIDESCKIDEKVVEEALNVPIHFHWFFL